MNSTSIFNYNDYTDFNIENIPNEAGIVDEESDFLILQQIKPPSWSASPLSEIQTTSSSSLPSSGADGEEDRRHSLVPNYYDGNLFGSLVELDPPTRDDILERHKIREWYSFMVNEEGKVKLKLPPEVKNIHSLIYVIRNREKQRYLIGETGQTLQGRISGYLTEINKKDSEKRAKEPGKKDFLTDMKSNPTHFDVGIFYKACFREDIKRCEILVIEHQSKVWNLYNDRAGGGGSLAHAVEEAVTYCIPKDPKYTPEKYYSASRVSSGKVRFEFSPGFDERIRKVSMGTGSIQTFAYCIKNIRTGERYIGVTCDPHARAYMHQLIPEYADESLEKYDPTKLTGVLHWEISKAPTDFAFGLFPLRSANDFDESLDDEHYFPVGRARLEKTLIQLKESLVSQNGYNCNGGGGGGIGSSKSKKLRL